MSQIPKPTFLTADEVRRLADKRWLVDAGLWSVQTARQWLARQTCLQHIKRRGYLVEAPVQNDRSGDDDDLAAVLAEVFADR